MSTNNIKYTTDGKKVVVIGDLNQTEKIVQEIFVTEQGDEIPQGERFIVKSLLDNPSKSWKEKMIEELELRYEKDKKYWEDKTSSIVREKKNAYDALSARVKWLRAVAKEPRDEQFKKIINTIATFLSDDEKWVFVKKYSGWELELFNEDGINILLDRFESGYGSKSFDSMRLLSLYGKADGNLEFRVNDYSDGSGSDSNVVFFKSRKEALTFMQNEFDKLTEYSESYLEIAKKYELKVDSEKLRVFQEKKKDSIKKYISEAESKLDELKKQLTNVENK